jgi:hypothetical protein
MTSSTSTLDRLILSTESTTRGQFPVNDIPGIRQRARVGKSIENAVYSYIRAVRALGRTAIITTEIADALSLTVADVNRAISSLKKKGVRELNG